MRIKLNVLSAHVSAGVSTAVSLVALVHPGFHLPSVVQGLVSTVAILVAGGIEIYHLLTHRQIQGALAMAEATAKAAKATAPTGN